jgi:hypothetical protein
MNCVTSVNSLTRVFTDRTRNRCLNSARGCVYDRIDVVQTGSGTCPGSYRMATGGIVPEVKLPRPQAVISLLSAKITPTWN